MGAGTVYSYLGISIDSMLNMDMLRGSKVLGGRDGLSNRITKVNVMEVPDIIEWVSEGEFLITTAYSIKDNIYVLSDIIPKLKEKGVVGLGIKVGRYVSELPEDIIKLADDIQFPIIELPFCISHTDLISVILTEAINNQMNMLLKMEEFNREVMEIMMRGGGIKEIAKKLYDNLGNSLAIYESLKDSCEVISDSISDKNLPEKIIYRYVGGKNVAYNLKSEELYKLTTDNINGKQIDRVTIPIVIEKIEYGFIFIWLDNKPLTPLDNMIIESYVHIAALEFVKQLSIYNMESNYKLEFIDGLLSKDYERQKSALEKSKTFNFNKDLKYSVIIILLKDLHIGDMQRNNNINLIQDSLNNLLFILNRKTKQCKGHVLYVDKNDRVFILYGNTSDKTEEEIKKEVIVFCKDIECEAQSRLGKSKLLLGIGRTAECTKELWKSYDQAKLIIESLHSNSLGSVIHYDDLGLYRILSFEGLQNELREFCIDTIKPLIDYDKENNAELTKTLRYYFICHGNMKKIAEKMYMHYNTIIYRLQKIEEITGLNLEDSDNRLNLEVALKAIDFIQI